MDVRWARQAMCGAGCAWSVMDSGQGVQRDVLCAGQCVQLIASLTGQKTCDGGLGVGGVHGLCLGSVQPGSQAQ